MSDEKGNRRIWDKVWQTDPAHVKSVSFGRKFSAIDTYYRIQRATEVFGPVGQGWGWTSPVYSLTPFGEVVLLSAQFVLWWREPDSEDRHEVPAVGAVEILSRTKDGKPRLDSDAYKKVQSDALTKALSFLGFSADVFFGAFDDNHYVQEAKRKAEEAKRGPDPANLLAEIRDLGKRLPDAAARERLGDAVRAAGQNPDSLAGILNRLRAQVARKAGPPNLHEMAG